MSSLIVFFVFFFFQAEDGIRDLTVTGVQTCALPISRATPGSRPCDARSIRPRPPDGSGRRLPTRRWRIRGDRKSTRLNSSHSQISYAVFCLKKKKKKKNIILKILHNKNK